MSTSIMKNIGSAISKTGFKFKKHSPEILVVAGTVGAVASAVLACKATFKVNDILDETKETVQNIHDVVDGKYGDHSDDYTEEDAKQDLTKVYIQTGIKFAKLYAPAVILGTLSICSILASNNILRKRNVALAAAYATIDSSFKDYRNRVISRFGEEIDRELKYNIQSKKITETVVDEETGKEKKVKKTIQVANEVSGYARFFEEYTVDDNGNTVKNPYWDKTPEYNLMFLKSQQQYANDLLRAKKRLFLNDVYKMLGLPESKAGQIVGWVYDEENPVGDNFVDFGLYSGGSQNYSDFIYGTDDAILLDFNVDGNIWDLM